MYWGFRPYVSVAQRQAKARREMEKLSRKGVNIQPVKLDGRTIAGTFWGKAWCEHLEKFSDFENRLPRGRAYVRNGSVCHLDIQPGKIAAKVSGSSLYEVTIKIRALGKEKWDKIKGRCAGQIGSILELLKGRLSGEVMAVVTDRDHGLFPSPKEIELDCSCPDWADMCKQVAAVLYGVGARLDHAPDLLFRLRNVDHGELIVGGGVEKLVKRGKGQKVLADAQLSEVFGIEVSAAASLGKIPPQEPEAETKAETHVPKEASAKARSSPSPAKSKKLPKINPARKKAVAGKTRRIPRLSQKARRLIVEAQRRRWAMFRRTRAK